MSDVWNSTGSVLPTIFRQQGFPTAPRAERNPGYSLGRDKARAGIRHVPLRRPAADQCRASIRELKYPLVQVSVCTIQGCLPRSLRLRWRAPRHAGNSERLSLRTSRILANRWMSARGGRPRGEEAVRASAIRRQSSGGATLNHARKGRSGRYLETGRCPAWGRKSGSPPSGVDSRWKDSRAATIVRRSGRQVHPPASKLKAPS